WNHEHGTSNIQGSSRIQIPIPPRNSRGGDRLDDAKAFSLVSGKSNRANRDALAEKMDLRNVIGEIAALGLSVGAADGFEAIQNVRLDDAQFQFQVGGQGVAHKIVVNLVRGQSQWNTRGRISHFHVAIVKGIGAEDGVRANSIVKNRITIGGKGAHPEVYDAI